MQRPKVVTSYRPVATLTVEPQDSYSLQRRVYADDDQSFNPWNYLIEPSATRLDPART